MAQTIRIKRSTSTATPSSLTAGELAYSGKSDSNKLFIGHPDGTTGVVAVGGHQRRVGHRRISNYRFVLGASLAFSGHDCGCHHLLRAI